MGGKHWDKQPPETQEKKKSGKNWPWRKTWNIESTQNVVVNNASEKQTLHNEWNGPHNGPEKVAVKGYQVCDPC